MSQPDHLQLRTAFYEDLSTLEHWQRQPHVQKAVPEEHWNWKVELQRTPEWRELLIAELNGRPIGFIQIIDPALEETHYWGKVEYDLRAVDIWIGEPENLGKGYGSKMMRLALDRCFKTPQVKAVIIDPLASNTKVFPFYERLGFKFLRNESFGEHECWVYRLERADWLLKKELLHRTAAN